MKSTEKIALTCNKCGKSFYCNTPPKTGNYTTTCINKDCQEKIRFHYSEDGINIIPEVNETQYGLLENGSYRFRCSNESCRQLIIVSPNRVKTGHNAIICPKCKTSHEFDIEPTENNLLQCKTAGCNGIIKKQDRGDGIYLSECDKCGQKYSLIIQGGKVLKTIMKTPEPLVKKAQWAMKLVVGNYLTKKEYYLTTGVHYIGRIDDINKSNFEIKDKFASSRSLRIDVNSNGGNLIYKLTVERASNPVYHNSRRLNIGEVAYLNYGDTLKLGKTIIKIQKAI